MLDKLSGTPGYGGRVKVHDSPAVLRWVIVEISFENVIVRPAG